MHTLHDSLHPLGRILCSLLSQCKGVQTPSSWVCGDQWYWAPRCTLQSPGWAHSSHNLGNCSPRPRCSLLCCQNWFFVLSSGERREHVIFEPRWCPHVAHGAVWPSVNTKLPSLCSRTRVTSAPDWWQDLTFSYRPSGHWTVKGLIYKLL